MADKNKLATDPSGECKLGEPMMHGPRPYRWCDTHDRLMMVCDQEFRSPSGAVEADDKELLSNQEWLEHQGRTLLPCPFCGGTVFGIRGGGAYLCRVGCEHCGATTGDESDRERAVRLWNTRASTPSPASAGWQDIETAPKDGEDVLLWVGGEMEIAHWRADANAWDTYDGWLSDPQLATHWMRPTPPSTQAGASASQPEKCVKCGHEKIWCNDAGFESCGCKCVFPS